MIVISYNQLHFRLERKYQFERNLKHLKHIFAFKVSDVYASPKKHYLGETNLYKLKITN